QARVAVDVRACRTAADYFNPRRPGSGRAVHAFGSPAGRTEESGGRRRVDHDSRRQARRVYARGEPESVRSDQSIPGQKRPDRSAPLKMLHGTTEVIASITTQ